MVSPILDIIILFRQKIVNKIRLKLEAKLKNVLEYDKKKI